MSAQAPTWPMIRALGGIGCLCAVLIAGTYQLTLPTIERKKAEYLAQAVYRALPGSVTTRTFAYDGSTFALLDQVPAAELICYAGYDEQERLVGLALEASGQGFQDVIRVLYGYDVKRQVVIGFEVLASRETPGLGDKIEKDPAFLANFQALDVALDVGGGLSHPLEMVPKGAKTKPWQIDAISGATISSRAVTELLGKHTAQTLPLLQKHRRVFEEVGP